MAIPKRYENIDFRPTQAMARNAERGLDSRREFGRGGTSVGVARARDIKNRVNLSPETVRRMFSYFSRHEVDKQAEGFSRGEDGYPSAGRIAWDLWGGDEGFTWSRERTRQMKTADANVKEWVVNPDRDLPVIVRDEWDGDQARRNLLEFARDDDGVINPAIARRGFLAYDNEAEQVQASYLFPIADIVEDGMVVVSSALSAALSRLPQTNKLTEEQIADARMVAEEYQALFEEGDEMPAKEGFRIPSFKEFATAVVDGYKSLLGHAGIKATRIGTHVQMLREEMGLTQAQAAAQLPIAISTLGQIERGEIVTPSTPVIEAMAELYDVSVMSLTEMLRDGAMPLDSVSVNKDALEKMHDKLVKSLGDGKVGGNLVLFTNPSSPDLTGEYFDKDTNYGVNDGDELYIDVEHSTNGMVKNVPIGHAKIKFTDAGIALDGQLWLDSFFDGDKYIEDLLRKRADYELLIKKHGFDRVRKFVGTVADYTYKLLQEEEDALGWSSEVYEKSEPVRVKNNNTTYIKEWLIEKATLTPRPAEPRNAAFVKSIDEAIIELKEDNSMTDIQELDNEAELLPDVEETVEPTVEERLATLEAVSLKQHNDSQAHIKSLEGKIERLEAVVKAKSLATGAPRTSTKTRHDLLRDILNSTPASAKGVNGYEVSEDNVGVERAKSATVKTEVKRKGGRTMPSRGR